MVKLGAPSLEWKILNIRTIYPMGLFCGLSASCLSSMIISSLVARQLVVDGLWYYVGIYVGVPELCV